MTESITANTIQEAILINFKDNPFLEQIKTCIRQDQQQFFVMICKGLQQNLSLGDLIYRLQTLRLCKILVELANDCFNYNHFSINVLPTIVVLSSEDYYKQVQRNLENERNSMISLIQLSKDIIRGWAQLFPQIPGMEGANSLSEFLKTYLQMELGQKIQFPPYQYYQHQVIQIHRHPNYEACVELWRNQNEFIDTNEFPAHNEQPMIKSSEEIKAKKDLQMCQTLLAATRDSLKDSQGNNQLLQEKVSSLKKENADFIQKYAELIAKRRRQEAPQPNETLLLFNSLQNQNQKLNEENMQLQNRIHGLEGKNLNLLQELQQIQGQFQTKIFERDEQIFTLKQKISESNQVFQDQLKNQELLTVQLNHFRRSMDTKSSENVSLSWHQLQIQANSQDYEVKLLAKEMEIRKLQQQITILRESEIGSSMNNQFKTNELQSLNKNYIKTIRDQQEKINQIQNQNTDLEKQFDNLNKIIKENKQEIKNLQKDYETKFAEQQLTITNLEQKCYTLSEKLRLERETHQLISATSPSNGPNNRSNNIVDFTNIQLNHQQSQRGNGFRSLNQSVQYSFRNSIQNESPLNNNNQKIYFPLDNSSLQQLQIYGNGIFHTDNYFQFAQQSEIKKDQKILCKVSLKNISVSKIRNLKLQYSYSSNNLQSQPLIQNEKKSELSSGEVVSFTLKEIPLSDIKPLGIILEIQSTNFQCYKVFLQLFFTSLVNYYQIQKKDFQEHWNTGNEAVNHSEFQMDQRAYENKTSRVHAHIPNSLLMNNQLGLYGSIDEYWFCCKISYSEQDSKIKIILKDLSKKNEISRKLLIGYTELFSE